MKRKSKKEDLIRKLHEKLRPRRDRIISKKFTRSFPRKSRSMKKRRGRPRKLEPNSRSTRLKWLALSKRPKTTEKQTEIVMHSKSRE